MEVFPEFFWGYTIEFVIEFLSSLFDLQLERLNTESEGQDGGDGDNSLKDFQQSTIRYANLKLGPGSEKDPEPPTSKEKSPRGIRFHVRSLGWVEMEDSDLSPGKSSLAVNNCIRQLSYRKNDIRDTAGIWGEVGEPIVCYKSVDLFSFILLTLQQSSVPSFCTCSITETTPELIEF